jgi:hypothetical protein
MVVMRLQHRDSAGKLLEITALFELFSRPFPVVPKKCVPTRVRAKVDEVSPDPTIKEDAA